MLAYVLLICMLGLFQQCSHDITAHCMTIVAVQHSVPEDITHTRTRSTLRLILDSYWYSRKRCIIINNEQHTTDQTRTRQPTESMPAHHYAPPLRAI